MNLAALTFHLQTVGNFGYWIVFIIAFLEAVAFVGTFVPGGLFMMATGFLAAHGYFDLGDLILFASIGAILGDAASFYLGARGTHFFKNENKLLKASHLEQGERFFARHGSKSIFLGRMIGPLRPIMPFVAGLARMNPQKFWFWNIVSGIVWASLYLSIGYFFGDAYRAIAKWSARLGFIALGLFILAAATWFLLRRSGPAISFIRSVARSLYDAIITNPDVRRIIHAHPRLIAIIRNRLDKTRFTGLPLTVFAVLFIYTASLFIGITEDLLTTDPIIGIDMRVATILAHIRNPFLATVFAWITLLSTWQIIVGLATAASLFFIVSNRKKFLLPFWLMIGGVELFVFLSKWTFARPRPLAAAYAETTFSFPSGHAAIALAFYGYLGYMVFRSFNQWNQKIATVLASALIIALIGASRIYLGVHYVSDVWAGYLMGALWLILGIALSEWLASRSA